MCSSSNRVRTAKWIGDCFIYTTAANRLNYFIGTESYTITPFDTYVARRDYAHEALIFL